jgi:putative aminopeptidase FrvX
MGPPVLRILERIARQPTAPLHEHAVAREAARVAREAGAGVRTDVYGNLVVRPPGPRRGPALWLVAHMDHPGLGVIAPGVARLLGGVRPEYLRRGTRLRLYHDGDPVPARILRYIRSAKTIRFEGGSRARRGDFGVWELEDFRTAGGRVHARQLDDLAGSAVSLAALGRAAKSRSLNLNALLTRAEEIGFVGTLGAIASRVVPREAWIINVEASRALPGVEIGGGPIIRVGDRQRTFDASAEDLLLAARERLPKSKPVQRALMSGGTCEATAWGLHGYRATGVAIPLGNYHNMGPRNRLEAEFVAAKDLTGAVDLIELAARQAPSGLSRAERVRGRFGRYLRRYGRQLQASRPKV